MKKKLKNFSIKTLGILILIILWELIPLIFDVPEYIFPRLTVIFNEFLINPVFFLEGLYKTFIESLLGILLGGSIAYILALIFSFSKTLKLLFYHWFVALKTIPIIAISPMIIIWVGSGIFSKILMASIITFFPILVTTLEGLFNITENQVNLLKSMNASRFQMFIRLRIPMSFSYFFAGLKIASPLSAIGAIVAEFSGANEGLGYIILKSSWESNTSSVMAAVVLASIMGITMYKLIELVEHIVGKYYPHFIKQN